jgi:hypothetical protein
MNLAEEQSAMRARHERRNAKALNMAEARAEKLADTFEQRKLGAKFAQNQHEFVVETLRFYFKCSRREAERLLFLCKLTTPARVGLAVQLKLKKLLG